VLVWWGRSVLRLAGWPLQVAGAQHVPVSGSVVVAANHVSYLDPVMLGLALERCGRGTRFMAMRELFAIPVVGQLLRGARQIPVDRQRDSAASLRFAEAALDRGHLVALFCEGTIRPEFDPANVKTGAARLGLATNAPLLPAAVWGGQRLHARPRGVWRRGRPLLVRFGPALTADPGESVEALRGRLGVAIAVQVRAAAGQATAA
jgi:1-acyl-sn-glycerol-3-phosphate acyltransferase